MREQMETLLATLRQRKPLIHNITNLVVTNFTANGTLAIGASPVMTSEPREVADMVAHAGALVLNAGTLTERTVEAMQLAGHAANRLKIPVILDPVGYGTTAYRNEQIQQLLAELDIAVVRGNAAEIAALCGVAWGQKGVDASDDGGDRVQLAQSFVNKYGTTVAVTGKTDVVAGLDSTVVVEGGHPLLPYITGSGCLATAVVGACHAVTNDSTLAAVAGLSAMAVAAELAARSAKGPGELNWRLIDALYLMTPRELRDMAKLSVLEGNV